MGTVLGYIIALAVVGGLLFLAASFAFGRGEEMAPALPEGTPVELPDDRLAGGEDLRSLRLSVAVRGYRMDEVDWLLDRLSDQVDTRDREIARLRSVLHVERVPEPDEPELLTHPHPAVRDLPTDWTRPTDAAPPQAATDRRAVLDPDREPADPGPDRLAELDPDRDPAEGGSGQRAELDPDRDTADRPAEAGPVGEEARSGHEPEPDGDAGGASRADGGEPARGERA